MKLSLKEALDRFQTEPFLVYSPLYKEYRFLQFVYTENVFELINLATGIYSSVWYYMWEPYIVDWFEDPSSASSPPATIEPACHCDSPQLHSPECAWFGWWKNNK